MRTITIQDLKTNGASVLRDEGPTYLIVNSKVKSVILSPREYVEYVEALEELEDIKAIAEARKETPIPFDEAVKLIEDEREVPITNNSIGNKTGKKTSK